MRPHFMVGCDPEVFVLNKKTGTRVSAWGMIPGTKLTPHPVNHGAIQVDGNALEFNTDPAATRDEFVNNVSLVFQQLKDAIGPNFETVIDPVTVFDEDYWKTLPAAAKELGCDPDFDAHTGEQNPTPVPNPVSMRAAGGHVHLSWGKNMDIDDPNHFEDCCLVAKHLDVYLGLYALKWDKDNLRRKLYGRAGAFRPKHYGLEYRALSNKWLRDPELVGWVFDATIKCGTDLYDNGPLPQRTLDNAKYYINNGQRNWEMYLGSPVKGLSLPEKFIEV